MSAPTYLPGVEPTKYTLKTDTNISLISTEVCITHACMCNFTCLVSDRSCSLIRWIHSSSSGARYDIKYSSRSLLKKVGDSPALALLPFGNRGNRGLIHILYWGGRDPTDYHNQSLHQVIIQQISNYCCSSVNAQHVGVIKHLVGYIKFLPLCFLVPVSSDEVGSENDDSEAFLIPQQHHLPVQRHRTINCCIVTVRNSTLQDF